MATLGVYFQHGFVGKASQAQPYTARANSRYIQRQSATHSVHTYLMPENYNARQRWFFDHENGLRKNGRVVDKFIIAIPRGVTEEHAVEVLHRFGKGLGQKRCPYMFTLQGFDTKNHHAHMIYVDKDFETGERVFGTTKRNSTRGIKLEWETIANEAFEELGYDVRVKVHLQQQLEAENDNEKVEEAELEAELSEIIEAETEDAGDGEDDMDGIIMKDREEHTSLAAHDIRLLFSSRTELGYLRNARKEVQNARKDFQDLVRQRDQAAFERDIYATTTTKIVYNAEQAELALANHTRANGKLKGWGFTTPRIKLFGITIPEQKIATVDRLEAEQAKELHERLAPAAEVVRDRLRQKDEAVAGLSAQATQAERDAYTKQKELERLYCGPEAVTEEEVDRVLDREERTFQGTISKVARDVPLEYAKEAFLAVEITNDEYEAYLIEAGHRQELEEFYENRDKYEIIEVPDEGEEEGEDEGEGL